MRNPRKKAFWIFNIIALAIFFGVLGATVWKPDSNNNNGNGNPTPTPSASTTRPAPSNPMVPTPVGSTVPTAVVVPTPVTVSTTRDPPPPTSKPTGTKDEYFRCRELCGSPWGSCRSNCESSDAAYKACVAPCNGDFKCEVNCKNSNGCLKDCNSTLDKCNGACPSYTP
ncbi:hypothetical protein BGZ74_006474 [Mortierella antarctica]|nr:hypothetical protein BGZ74_006474 [Mortierella antarctica]